MARTFRNRRHAPKHTRVTDNGSVIHRKQLVEDAPKPFRRCYLLVEKKAERKQHHARYRARVKHAMNHQRWENIPRWRRTSGWLTW
jgi:hypothetical protein